MSAIAEHWEQVIKERLAEYAMNRHPDSNEMAAETLGIDLVMFQNLLDYYRYTYWQDGHDTALMHGQSQNPHDQEPR